MSLKLHFLRHGQTQSSRDNLYCGGDIDAPLTDEGQQMAQQFAEAWHQTPWKQIHVSPLQRARDTAAPIASRCGQSVQIGEGLREIRYGAWDGKTVDHVKQNFADDYRRWMADPGWVAPTGGETAFDVLHRSLGLVRQACAQHRDGNLLFVSHKATIRIMLCGLLGLDIGQFRYRLGCPVASLSIVELAPQGPLLHALADRSHLDARLRALAGT